MAVYMKRKKERWTEEDIIQLRMGIVPEGRSESSAKAKAKLLGITAFEREEVASSRWTPEEIEALERGEQPPGRSEVACFYKGRGLGLSVKFDNGKMTVARTKANRTSARRAKLLERARKYAKLRSGGESLAEIGRRDGVSRQRVNEIIGELSISR